MVQGFGHDEEKSVDVKERKDSNKFVLLVAPSEGLGGQVAWLSDLQQVRVDIGVGQHHALRWP